MRERVSWWGRLRTRVALSILGMCFVCGALCGEAVWWSSATLATEQAPQGWEFEHAPATWVRAEDLGPLAPRPGGWSLAGFRGMYESPGTPMHQPRSVSLEALVPPGGQLDLWLDAPNAPGARGIVLDRIGATDVRLVQLEAAGATELPCVFDPPALESGHVSMDLAVGDGVLRLDLNDRQWQCPYPATGPVRLHLRPGLRRLNIERFAVDGTAIVPKPALPRALLWALGGLLVGLVVMSEVASSARPGLVAFTTLPLVFTALLVHLDLGPWAERAYIAEWAPVPWLGLLIPVSLAATAKVIHLLWRTLRGRGLVGSGVRVAVFAAVLALGGRALDDGAFTWIWVLALGIGLGVLVWANANAPRLRWYNLTSLLAACALSVCIEGVLRTAGAGRIWDPDQSAGHGRADVEDLEDQLVWDFVSMEVQQHTSYPMRGWPVAFPPRDDRVRVVAMGGSTTGGAWQNDDLDEFYPARLGDLLGPGFEVLNQGVGGWTTWHIRTYLASGQLERLSPDVLILYVGHNDVLTEATLPYDELYRRWQTGTFHRRGSALLNRLRIYRALRFLLESLRPGGARVAVPVDRARDNLAWIADALAARGGRLILASEGESPDPSPLDRYNEMMRVLAAQREGVSFVDTAGTLHAQLGAQLFLDNCHLTDRGHRVVARTLFTELQRVGVVPPAAASP